MTKRKRSDPASEGLIFVEAEEIQALEEVGSTVPVTGEVTKGTLEDWPVGNGVEPGVAEPGQPVTGTEAEEGEVTTADAFWALLLAVGYTVW